jgi:putative transposase
LPNLIGFENLRGLNGRGLNKPQQAFSNFFNAYAKAFNKKYNRTGKLFEERFKRKEVKNDSYFTQLIYYIHANPQKHGFIDDFSDYPHSSYQSFLNAGKTSLMRDAVLDWFGGKDWFIKYHEEKHRQLTDEKKFEIESRE